MAPSTFHVLGGGALGRVLGAALARHDRLAALLLREACHATAAIRVHSADASADPPAAVRVRVETSSGEGAAIGHLLVATKANHAAVAVRGVLPRLTAASSVVFVGNGQLSVAEELREVCGAVGCSVALGSTTQAAYVPADAGGAGDAGLDVVWAAAGDTFVGVDAGEPRPSELEWLGELARSLERGGVPTSVDANIRQRLWEKLAANAFINPTSALLGCTNGDCLEGDGGAALCAAVCAEVAAVGAACGVGGLDAGRLLQYVTAVAHATCANRSSMLQDMDAGRETEIAHINGWLAATAKARGLACGTCEALEALVRLKTVSRER